jgi:hypothetical protein
MWLLWNRRTNLEFFDYVDNSNIRNIDLDRNNIEWSSSKLDFNRMDSRKLLENRMGLEF